MHIIEKMTRQGDEIRYDMTLENPDVRSEPWYCEVYEEGNISTRLRH
jgi:hypothetical protein